MDDIDYEEAEDEEEDSREADCGRWDQSAGGLTKHCRLAGTEFCEWDCPLHRWIIS